MFNHTMLFVAVMKQPDEFVYSRSAESGRSAGKEKPLTTNSASTAPKRVYEFL